MFKWIFAAVLLVGGAVGAFYMFVHPPVRLMTPPLVYEYEGETILATLPEQALDGRIDIFYATNRFPIGLGEAQTYTIAPDRTLRAGSATLRIGDETTTLEQIRAWTTQAEGDARPYLHLEALNEKAVLPDSGDPDAAAREWFAAIDAAMQVRQTKNILIFVHGANTTLERAAGHASQLQHYSGDAAVVVLFTWPTAENFLFYLRDIKRASASAPHLARLISLLADNTVAEKIDLFSYSSGGTVASSGLALLAEEDPEGAGRLGEVVHIAPDASLRLFVEELRLYAPLADRVTTFLNLADSALRLANIMTGESRAGRPDVRKLSEEDTQFALEAALSHELQVVQITPRSMPDVARTSHTYWYDNQWVSNDLILTLALDLSPEARGLDPHVAEAGAPFWTFPEDYADRIRRGLEALKRD